MSTATTPAASGAAPADMRKAYEAHVLKLTGRKPLTWGEAAEQYDLKIELRANYVDRSDEFGWQCWQAAALASREASSVMLTQALREAEAGLEVAVARMPQTTDFVPCHVAALKIVRAALASPQVAPAPEPMGEPVAWPDDEPVAEIEDWNARTIMRFHVCLPQGTPLYLRPAAAPVQVAQTPAAALSDAEKIGQTGAPYSAQEHALFRAYLKGHCWKEGPWDEEKQEHADQWNRVLFAVWRARAALAPPMQAPAAADDARDAARSQHDADSRELRSLCIARDEARRERDLLKVDVAALEASVGNLSRLVDDLRPGHDRYQYLRERPVDTIDTGGVFAGLVPDNVVLNGDDLDFRVDYEMAALPAAKPAEEQGS